MDITRNAWLKTVVAVAAVLMVYGLLNATGALGSGRYSLAGFVLYALAALGLQRLLSGLVGMIWVAMAPTVKLRN